MNSDIQAQNHFYFHVALTCSATRFWLSSAFYCLHRMKNFTIHLLFLNIVTTVGSSNLKWVTHQMHHITYEVMSGIVNLTMTICTQLQYREDTHQKQ